MHELRMRHIISRCKEKRNANPAAVKRSNYRFDCKNRGGSFAVCCNMKCTIKIFFAFQRVYFACCNTYYIEN